MSRHLLSLVKNEFLDWTDPIEVKILDKTHLGVTVTYCCPDTLEEMKEEFSLRSDMRTDDFLLPETVEELFDMLRQEDR